MGKARPKTRRTLSTVPPTAHPNDHDLIGISQWLPGKEPTGYGVEITDWNEYETHFWRCRKCGQERNRRHEFTEPCAVESVRGGAHRQLVSRPVDGIVG